MFARWLAKTWYQPHPVRWFLSPLSGLYRLICATRRIAYRSGILSSYRPAVPVIVVGNINVGGTGKTPAVIYLAELLKEAGYHPGIISRGYGGSTLAAPLAVTTDSNPAIVGDEPLLIARRTLCPLVVFPCRADAVKVLLSKHNCDVIITDDGLQHYALVRDIEIVVIDGTRQFGNGYCIPAGPLREPISRLNHVDFILDNGTARHGYAMQFKSDTLVNLADNTLRKSLSYFIGKPCHAIAGIGNPQRFFDQLKASKLNCTTHSFGDHHAYTDHDLNFGDNMPIIMTEKDAVKCQVFARDNMWYLPIHAVINPEFSTQLLAQLDTLKAHPQDNENG